MEIMFGKERAANLLLDSPKVSPKKLVDSGFEFKAPSIVDAMEMIAGNVMSHNHAKGDIHLQQVAKKIKQARDKS